MTIEHILNSIKEPVHINQQGIILYTENFLNNLETLEILQQNKNKIFDILKEQLSLLKNYSLEEKKIISKNLNELKQLVFDVYGKKKKFFDEMLLPVDKNNIYLPVNHYQGSLHPITITTNKIYHIMKSMGFSFINAPEIDDPVNIFEKLRSRIML